jgi:hypothetical protein
MVWAILVRDTGDRFQRSVYKIGIIGRRQTPARANLGLAIARPVFRIVGGTLSARTSTKAPNFAFNFQFVRAPKASSFVQTGVDMMTRSNNCNEATLASVSQSVEIRQVKTIEEYNACVLLQRDVFGLPI